MKNVQYFIEAKISFKIKKESSDTFFPVAPISFPNAIRHVRSGGSVFARNKKLAFGLAFAIGNGRMPVVPKKHSNKKIELL